MSSERRALVVGTGLIGGSIGLALRAQGWRVTGRDVDESRAARAVELGALDDVGDDVKAEITFVATPVGSIATEARAALRSNGVVTDVGGVKAPIVKAVADPRFVGGHPMAGSEQEGVDGADAGLFEGATWVLTPTDDTDAEAYTRVRAIVSSLGAEVVAVRPEDHDEIRVPVPDRPGVLAEVTTLVSELGVNMFDFETVHSSAGDRGVLVFLVEAGSTDLVRGALLARGYKPSARPLA